MASYDRKILHALLDSYENSLLSSGKNKVTVHISFKFTRRSMPEYFDESSMEYESIHACLRELEEKEFLTVEWRDKKPGNIVQKVILNTERVDEVYHYLKRTPKTVYAARQIQLLVGLEEECLTPAAAAFIDWLRQRIQSDLPVKEYFDLSDLQKSERLIRCVAYVEGNETPCYYREFSIRHFGDSKVFEEIKGTVRKALCRFTEGFEDADEKAVFAEYGIYDTPNYVYLKGEGILDLPACTALGRDGEGMAVYAACGDETGHMPAGPIDGEESGRGQGLAACNEEIGCHQVLPAAGDVPAGNERVNLNVLRQGIGISGEDLEHLHISGNGRTRQIITIENLTTFFRWREPDSLMIYLGGYHNQTRRRLLNMIYEQFPDAVYLHFGDIDAGGFEIYEDLCNKTGIPFQLYHMGIRELKNYEPYTKPLTANDRKRLRHMQEEGRGAGSYQEVIGYMLEHGVKLEQECILE